MLYSWTAHLPCTSLHSNEHLSRVSWKWRCGVYKEAWTDNFLGSIHSVWLSTFAASKSDLHLSLSLSCLDRLSSIATARSEWPDYRSYSIRRHRAHLCLNIRSHTRKLFSKDGGTAQWLSGSCSNTDISASSRHHLHGGMSALRPLVCLTAYVK